MLVDSAGNEYVDYAIIRMRHFETDKRKYYMYKQVVAIDHEKEQISFCHLPIKHGEEVRTCFNLTKEELVRDTVIVSAHYSDYRDLKRNVKMRD